MALNVEKEGIPANSSVLSRGKGTQRAFFAETLPVVSYERRKWIGSRFKNIQRGGKYEKAHGVGGPLCFGIWRVR